MTITPNATAVMPGLPPIPPQRWWITAFIAIGGSLILGLILWLVSVRPFFLGLPALAAGLGTGFLVSYTIWQTRIRRELPTIILALGLAILVYGSARFFGYLYFRHNASVSILQQSATPISQNQIDQLINEGLLNDTGADGFIGYLRYELDTGLNIQSIYGMERVRGYSVLLYWTVDVVIILGGTLIGVDRAIRRPYCRHCHHYYGQIGAAREDFGLERLGQVKGPFREEFISLLQNGRFEQAGPMLLAIKPSTTTLDVLIQRCDTCNTKPVTLIAYTWKAVNKQRHVPLRGSFLEDQLKGSKQRHLRLRATFTQEQFNCLMSFTAIDKLPLAVSNLNTWLLSITLGLTVLVGILVLASLFLGH